MKTPNKINAAYITHVLSQAVNIMRAQHSVGESIECVSKLLLLKRLIDQQPGMNSGNFSLEAVNLSEAISKLTADLEKHDPALEGVFVSSEANFWNRFSDEILQQVMQLLDELDLSPTNLTNANDLGQAYENFIEKYAEIERFQREVYTPVQVCRLLVELTRLEQVTSIYDPACGSGELLAAAVAYIQRSKGETAEIAVFGQTPIEQGQTIAKINLMLHGIHHPDIRLGNNILSPRFVANNQPMLFDIALANPPFGLKRSPEVLIDAKWSDRSPDGVPRNGSDRVYLYIQHVLASLKPNGKAAMILPRGVLFRHSEERIRKQLIEADQIEAVIELAPKLFRSTSIPVVVMVFNKNKIHKRRILLIDASHEYETGKGRNRLSPEQVDHIVSTYHDFSETEFSKLVSIEEIEANIYDLTIDRYIKQKQEEFDITAEIEQLRRLDTRQIELEESMGNYLRKLGIKL